MAHPHPDHVVPVYYAAMNGGVDCSVRRLLDSLIFESEHELDRRREVVRFLEGWQLEFVPALNEGTDEDPRVLRAIKPIGLSEVEIQRVSREGERPEIEFKESLLLDARSAEAGAPRQALQARSEEMILMVLKTICGFLNRQVGVLYIGISNAGVVRGIERDYPLLKEGKQDLDNWSLKLNELIESRFIDGKTICNHVQQSFCLTQGGTVCRLRITPRTTESFVRDGPAGQATTKVRCYVRQGTRTDEVTIEHMPGFIRSRHELVTTYSRVESS